MGGNINNQIDTNDWNSLANIEGSVTFTEDQWEALKSIPDGTGGSPAVTIDAAAWNSLATIGSGTLIINNEWDALAAINDVSLGTVQWESLGDIKTSVISENDWDSLRNIPTPSPAVSAHQWEQILNIAGSTSISGGEWANLASMSCTTTVQTGALTCGAGVSSVNDVCVNGNFGPAPTGQKTGDCDTDGVLQSCAITAAAEVTTMCRI